MDLSFKSCESGSGLKFQVTELFTGGLTGSRLGPGSLPGRRAVSANMTRFLAVRPGGLAAAVAAKSLNCLRPGGPPGPLP